MAHPNTTPSAARLEEAITVLFCLIDDAYRLLNPDGCDAYGSLKRLADSEVLTLALFQQLRGCGERTILSQGRPEVLLPPVPGRGGIASIFLPSPDSQVEAFLGTAS